MKVIPRKLIPHHWPFARGTTDHKIACNVLLLSWYWPDRALECRWWRRCDVIMRATASQIGVSIVCLTVGSAGNSPVTSEFPAQKARDAEKVSIWWRHHVMVLTRDRRLQRKIPACHPDRSYRIFGCTCHPTVVRPLVGPPRPTSQPSPSRPKTVSTISTPGAQSSATPRLRNVKQSSQGGHTEHFKCSRSLQNQRDCLTV